ncbi:MFS transporter [Clostridium sp. MCC353]|uniref:MFS transporter n=1 Tax=Clostridium sp. MCC353 TaxID=2592646 RepID=UPI001C00CD92|nr:MFS transporter [Clostridium sp. MCC353]MBT9776644.1 MFS transporter [Clostridium sp. MCC353]
MEENKTTERRLKERKLKGNKQKENKQKGNKLKECKLKTFLVLWSTQSLSQLGSAMTNFALTLWLYQKTGSALQTALLSICSYAPYVLMSIFAGALSDRWNKKKIMLVSDSFAACSTIAVLILLKTGLLRPIHLYVLNAVSGLMNTIQQPASDVAMTLITPKEQYQKTSGLRSLSQSVVTVLHPMLATALFAAGGMDTVILVDLTTFAIAFLTLLFFVKIPGICDGRTERKSASESESLFSAAKAGLLYLRKNPMILYLIFFLAGVNLVASAFDATLPAYVLPRENGGEAVLGLVTSCAGIATLIGSLIVTVLPKPNNRIRVITGTMLFSLTIENFLLAFTRIPGLWCMGQFFGWMVVPVMNANLDVILRTTIPVDMQGRVYSCRNTLQFFTIPVGFFLGGLLVDQVFEPIMARVQAASWLAVLFGSGKGSGAAIMMFVLGLSGAVICIVFARILKKYQFREE